MKELDYLFEKREENNANDNGISHYSLSVVPSSTINWEGTVIVHLNHKPIASMTGDGFTLKSYIDEKIKEHAGIKLFGLGHLAKMYTAFKNAQE